MNERDAATPVDDCERPAGKANEPAREPFSQDTRDRLVRLAFRFLWNREDAEDVVQESLALAHCRANQLRQSDRWWSWLCRIVVHRCHSAARAGRWWRRRQSPPDCIEAIASRDSPARATEFKELLRRALPQLPTRQREVIVLRHLEGMSYEDIGDILEISPVTARVHARAGLESLRQMMAGQGLEFTGE